MLGAFGSSFCSRSPLRIVAWVSPVAILASGLIPREAAEKVHARGELERIFARRAGDVDGGADPNGTCVQVPGQAPRLSDVDPTVHGLDGLLPRPARATVGADVCIDIDHALVACGTGPSRVTGGRVLPAGVVLAARVAGGAGVGSDLGHLSAGRRGRDRSQKCHQQEGIAGHGDFLGAGYPTS